MAPKPHPGCAAQQPLLQNTTVSMSFRFTWPKFDADFVEQAKLQIEGALNNGGLPSTIVGNIRVTDLHLGSQVRLMDAITETH